MNNQTQFPGYVLSCNGQPVKSLSFKPSSNSSYMGVYAQYGGSSAWIPLGIELPFLPTLQQVRDADRNIMLNSGSYQNAHFYLRSAEGNNVTTAFYTNAAGGAIQSGNTDSYTALNLQPLGGTLTYGGEEVATTDKVIQNQNTSAQAANAWINGNVGIKGYSNSYSLYVNGNAILGTIPASTIFSAAPFTLSNSKSGVAKTQLNLINGGGGANSGSAIDFYTYTDAGNGKPGVRVASVDNGTYSGNFIISTKGNYSTADLYERFKIFGTGGVQISSLSGAGARIVVADATGNLSTTIAGTAGQLLRRNGANTGYEFFTSSYLTNETDPVYTAEKPKIWLGDNATRTIYNYNFNSDFYSGVYNGYNASGAPQANIWHMLFRMRHATVPTRNGADIITTMGETGTSYIGWREFTPGSFSAWRKIFSEIDTIPVLNGGTGIKTVTGIVIGNGTSAMSGITGNANQLLKRNADDNAYEFFTPNYLVNEVDPVYLAAVPSIIKARQNFVGSESGIDLNAVSGSEHGFAYSDGTISSGIQGAYISFGQVYYNDGYQAQFLVDYLSDGFKFRSRNGNNGTWLGWKEVLTSSNVSGYSILNQNASAQAANGWISGNFTADGSINAGSMSTMAGRLNSASGIAVDGYINNSDPSYATFRFGNNSANIFGYLDSGGGGLTNSSPYTSGAMVYLSGIGASATINNYVNGTNRFIVTDKGVKLDAPLNSYHMFDGSSMGGDNASWGFYNSGTGALPIKVGGLTVSNSYLDTAPTNGLFVKGGIQLSKVTNAAAAISWYSPSYKAWTTYMANSETTTNGVNGNITAPRGALVTTWGLRSFIENQSGYGFTWESGISTSNPSIIAELSSNTGDFRVGGYLRGGNLASAQIGGLYADADGVIKRTGVQPVNVTSAVSFNTVGWVSIAYNGNAAGASGGSRATGKFTIIEGASSRHQTVTFYASYHYGTGWNINVLNGGQYQGVSSIFSEIRMLGSGTYSGAELQIYLKSAAVNVSVVLEENYQTNGWVLMTPTQTQYVSGLVEKARVHLIGLPSEGGGIVYPVQSLTGFVAETDWFRSKKTGFGWHNETDSTGIYTIGTKQVATYNQGSFRVGTAANNGFVRLQPGNLSSAGYIEFMGTNAIRTGYIGYLDSGASNSGLGVEYATEQGTHRFRAFNTSGPTVRILPNGSTQVSLLDIGDGSLVAPYSFKLSNSSGYGEYWVAANNGQFIGGSVAGDIGVKMTKSFIFGAYTSAFYSKINNYGLGLFTAPDSASPINVLINSNQGNSIKFTNTNTGANSANEFKAVCGTSAMAIGSTSQNYGGAGVLNASTGYLYHNTKLAFISDNASGYFSFGLSGSYSEIARIDSQGYKAMQAGGKFRMSDESYVNGNNSAWSFLTNANATLPIKTGSHLISDSYADTAPANGLFVKGQSHLIGNLGIGTTDPSYKLDVNGTTRISGQVTLSGLTGTGTRLVTTDGVGNLSTLTAPVLESGSYIPALSGSGTLAAKGFTYTRNGNIITVAGRISVSGLVSGSPFSVLITLPVATTVSNDFGIVGVCNSLVGTITSVVTAETNKAKVTFKPTATSYELNVVFQYIKQ